jgi:hypothetical protein
MRTEAGATVLMANDNLGHTEVSDEAKRKIAAALDDLRRLGEIDMEFKGFVKPRGKTP